MPRVRIELPQSFPFTTKIPVRITDINYGGHVGNDTILSIIHEIRVQFLGFYGYEEMNIAGAGLIMSDVAIEFKGELYYGNTIEASAAISEITRSGFEVVYKLEIEKDGKKSVIAHAKTTMICYSYERKKILSLPDEVKQKFEGR
ncbi:MAG: thioesterase [Bacteroidetes bacterium]|nr:MAG: thioesterase [Bacteroidota bacterium]